MKILKFTLIAVLSFSSLTSSLWAQDKKEAEGYLFTHKIFLENTPIKNQQMTGTSHRFIGNV